VRRSIEKLTDDVCGDSKGIVDRPIVLQIYSPTCPDLTLVDLPGITRIAVGGQDKDIEKITKNMCARYCGDHRTIVLVVVPANQDMACSDGLQMARNLDPKGIRTIGVITKIDIMDRGTDAKRMILNQEVPLRLGFVGVKNRAQEDIKNQVPVKEAIEKEKIWFSQHQIYSSMPSGTLGIETLTTKLTQVLFTHIKHNMPMIINEVRDSLRNNENELLELGPSLPESQG
jgi:vacuolar protein sorting-associated protein 1